MTAPTPIRSELRIGPIGVERVFIAIKAAARNPISAPNVVG
jgi:hypothetical protein